MDAAERVARLTAFARASLVASGMERVEHEGSVYFRGGTGPGTMVLLHGSNDQAGTWAPAVAALIARTRLLVPDLAGHGESEPASGPIALSSIVAQLHEILNHEGVATAKLVGNSMGGWIAILYALEHPERVGELVLEASGGMSWPIPVPLFARTREDALIALRAVHGPSVPIEEWWIDALLSRASGSPMARVAKAGVSQYFLDGRLSTLSVPTTLIWGAHDGVLPLAFGQAMHAEIRGSRLNVIEDAGHIPHLQQPERFIQCLTTTFSPNGLA